MNVKPEQAARVLLFRLRKEMNGAALDTMRYYGRDYARNYGCQIYAIRAMAREVGVDHPLAEYLFAQDVRELKIIALWIADIEQIAPHDVTAWLEGIYNSELAEQASHALLSRLPNVATLLVDYATTDAPLVLYALLLAVSRAASLSTPLSASTESLTQTVASIVDRHPNNALIARAAAALLGALPLSDTALGGVLQHLAANPTAELVREELIWRCESLQ